MIRDVTLLWALRSPCHLACRYCYFGDLEEDRLSPPAGVGQLSHLSRNDAPITDINAFLSSVGQSAVRRVFLAGGEPLNWQHALAIAEVLKDAGVEVIICTNGIPLNRPQIADQLIGLGIDAVSVSVDSADPGHHDRYRPSRTGRHGWTEVISGIRQLLAARGASAVPKIGVYTVITRRNVPEIVQVAELAAQLGADYFVPQPVSLSADHPLHEELSLRPGDRAAVTATLTALYRRSLPLALPAANYPTGSPPPSPPRNCSQSRAASAGTRSTSSSPTDQCGTARPVTRSPRHRQESGGPSLAIMPPSCSALPDPPARRTASSASRHCVNMWPLMGFDRIITSQDSG